MPGLRIFPHFIKSYREAKEFLLLGDIIYQASSPLSTYKRFRMPNGLIYSELESLLESPEDDYVLIQDTERENEE